MPELKTKATDASVAKFLDGIADERKRRDARAVMALMQEVTGEAPRMWGPSIVGFGSYHYKYESGHEGDMCLTGFSPRKRYLTLYIVPGFERYGALLKRLGKHTLGKSCLYLTSLDDVDMPTLRELIERSVRVMAKQKRRP